MSDEYRAMIEERFGEIRDNDRAPSPREVAASKHVAQGARVMDLGCGAMRLEPLLPPKCVYIPVDLFRRDDRTIVCDLDTHRWPRRRADVAICTGTLEYLADPGQFFRQARRIAPRLILSYHLSDTPGAARHHSWAHHLSGAALRRAYRAAGWVLESEERVGFQTLFVLR